MDVSPDTIEINDPELLAADRPRRAGRAALHRIPIQRRADLESAGAMPVFQRHAQRHPPAMERRTTGVVEVRNPSNKCNGMTYDAAGNLYVCEHVTSSLVMETPAGERKVLATHWEGKELNSPNDVVLRSDGTIYFTDPTYGRTPVFGRERPVELGFQAVYRVAPDGRAALRSQRLRPAEWAVPGAGRADPLRQRHRAGADSRLRRGA